MSKLRVYLARTLTEVRFEEAIIRTAYSIGFVIGCLIQLIPVLILYRIIANGLRG